MKAVMIRAVLAAASLGLGAGALAGEAGWPAYGGAHGGGRYSAADQITPANVDRLEVAWRYDSGDVSDGADDLSATSFQATPILHDGRLYFCTPFNRVIALDPATGRELWSFDPKVDLKKGAESRQTDGAPLRCRGVSAWADAAAAREACGSRIFLGTIDGRLFALDAASGRPCPGFGGADGLDLNDLPARGEGQVSISSPPAVIGAAVVVGLSVGDNGRADMPDGIVRAFDARDGTLLWHFDPIPEALSAQSGGGNVWAPPSVDVARGLVLLPTTSPSPDYFGGLRKGDLPLASAVVALRAADGSVAWSYQVVHHDLWDYDLPAQPVVAPAPVGPAGRPAVIQTTKMGFLYLLDAETGEPLFDVAERPVPASTVPGETASPTQPVPVLPPPLARTTLRPEEAFGLTVFDEAWCREVIAGLDNHGPFTPPSLRGSLQMPGFAGGSTWGGLAYSPRAGLIVARVMNIAGETRLLPRGAYDAVKGEESPFQRTAMLGTPYGMERRLILSPLGVPCSPPPWAELVAIDARTGAIRWKVPHGQVRIGPVTTPAAWGSPGFGGATVTASGLVFVGASLDDTLRAYDIWTGAELWAGALPQAAMASPMTYVAGGRQFVVVAAGGHAGLDRFGDSLVAFALPEAP